MLRLWPERLFACVLPESGWLQGSGQREVSRYTVDASSPCSVIEGLDKLLEGGAWPARTGVEVVVSDSIGRVLHLPWQSKLTSHAQREAYARGCFDQAGLALDGDWLVHAAYRDYQGGGIAYGLPRTLVATVREYLAARRLRLRSIMPLSAHAYWWNKTGIRRSKSMLLLEEHRRLNAMLFEDRKCMGIHVQPVGGDKASALRRLSSSVEATFSEVQRVQIWSALPDELGTDFVKQTFPRASIEHVEKKRWS